MPKYYPESVYQVPLSSIAIALAVILILVIVALGWQPTTQPHSRSAHPAPQPWLVGLFAFAVALPWFLMVLLAFGAWPALPPAIPMVGGLVLAAVAYLVIKHWAPSVGWQDIHRLALIVGTISATWVGGFIVLLVGKALPVDRLGQVTLNLIALGLLVRLAWSLRRQPVHAD